MNSQVVTLNADDSVCKAVALFRERHVYSLPVVDGQRKFLGMFGIHEMLGLLLPRAAVISSGLKEIGFVRDTMEHLCHRLQECGDTPVSRYLNAKVATVHPDAPFPELVLLLYQGIPNIPVVDDKGVLSGIISSWEIIDALMKE